MALGSGVHLLKEGSEEPAIFFSNHTPVQSAGTIGMICLKLKMIIRIILVDAEPRM